MFQNILILAPHTDDGELGYGGTMAKYLEEEKNIICAEFSIAEESVPANFPRDILATEFYNAMKIYGLQDENIISFHFSVRNIP